MCLGGVSPSPTRRTSAHNGDGAAADPDAKAPARNAAGPATGNRPGEMHKRQSCTCGRRDLHAKCAHNARHICLCGAPSDAPATHQGLAQRLTSLSLLRAVSCLGSAARLKKSIEQRQRRQRGVQQSADPLECTLGGGKARVAEGPGGVRGAAGALRPGGRGSERVAWVPVACCWGREVYI